MADTAAAKVATLQAGGPPPPEADTAAVVPYLADGTIDWAGLEDEYFPPLEDDRGFDCLSATNTVTSPYRKSRHT